MKITIISLACEYGGFAGKVLAKTERTTSKREVEDLHFAKDRGCARLTIQVEHNSDFGEGVLMALKATEATWWLVRAWFVVVISLFAGIALATPLPYHDSKGKYSFEIGAYSEDVIYFELKGGRDIETANVFAMSKPERVIVDLPTGHSLNWFRNLVVQRGSVQRVRVGSHDSKVRFVLDLSRAAKGGYEVSNKNGVLRITVKSPEKKGPLPSKDPTEIPATFTPKSILSPTPTHIVTFTGTHAIVSEALPTGMPTDTPSPMVEVQPTRTPTETPTTAVIKNVQGSESDKESSGSDKTEGKLTISPTLASIEISPTPAEGQSDSERQVKLLSLGYEVSEKGESCLRLKFSRVVSYQMVRSSQDLFVVTVDNVALQDASLSLAHFPPAAFSRFVSARAQAEKGGLKIFIYIEDGSYLLSIPKGSEIWLKAYGGDNK